MLKLPNDIINNIINFTSFKDLYNIILTSKTFYNYINSDECYITLPYYIYTENIKYHIKILNKNKHIKNITIIQNNIKNSTICKINNFIFYKIFNLNARTYQRKHIIPLILYNILDRFITYRHINLKINIKSLTFIPFTNNIIEYSQINNNYLKKIIYYNKCRTMATPYFNIKKFINLKTIYLYKMYNSNVFKDIKALKKIRKLHITDAFGMIYIPETITDLSIFGHERFVATLNIDNKLENIEFISISDCYFNYIINKDKINFESIKSIKIHETDLYESTTDNYKINNDFYNCKNIKILVLPDPDLDISYNLLTNLQYLCIYNSAQSHKLFNCINKNCCLILKNCSIYNTNEMRNNVFIDMIILIDCDFDIINNKIYYSKNIKTSYKITEGIIIKI